MEELDLLEEHLGAAIYSVALISAGLAALVVVLTRFPKTLQLRRPLGAWHIRPLDFALFVAIFVVWSALAFTFSDGLLEHGFGFTEEAPAPFELLALVGGLLMHGGLIALFLGWRQLHRSEAEGPLNPRAMALSRVFGDSVLYILAVYPVLFLVTLGWSSLLELLVSWGLPVSLEKQDVVALFAEVESHALRLGMAFLAVVVVPVSEELIFRAGLFRFLLRGLAPVSAAVLSGLLFGLLHFNFYSFLPLAFLGACLSGAYYVTGNIRVPILMHALFNLNTVLVVTLLPDALFN